MLGWPFYQFCDSRGKRWSLTEFPQACPWIAVRRGHYLGVVTCWIPDIGWGQPCSSHLEVSKSSLPGSWCRASKSLGISWVIKYLYYSCSFSHSWVHADEVTHGGPLSSCRMDTGHQKDQPLMRRLGHWASPTSREGRGLETEFNHVVHDVTSHAQTMKL